MRILTHTGIFHADEVLAAAMALANLDNEKIFVVGHGGDPGPGSTTNYIVRGEIQGGKSPYGFDYVLDQGGIFGLDIEEGDTDEWFDHHQWSSSDSPHRHPCGVPMATAGLYWKVHGRSVVLRVLKAAEIQAFEGLESGYRFPGYTPDLADEVVEIVRRRVVIPVDARDNGVDIVKALFEEEGRDLLPYTLSDIIASLNAPDPGNASLQNACFKQAFLVAAQTLRSAILQAGRQVADAEAARQAVAKCEGPVLVLEQFIRGWQDAIHAGDRKDILFGVFPSARGGWSVMTVPTEPGGREARKPFPQRWAGNPEKASSASGAECTFVHQGGFIAACPTKDDAVRLAEAAMTMTV